MEECAAVEKSLASGEDQGTELVSLVLRNGVDPSSTPVQQVPRLSSRSHPPLPSPPLKSRLLFSPPIPFLSTPAINSSRALLPALHASFHSPLFLPSLSCSAPSAPSSSPPPPPPRPISSAPPRVVSQLLQLHTTLPLPSAAQGFYPLDGGGARRDELCSVPPRRRHRDERRPARGRKAFHVHLSPSPASLS